MNRHLDPHPGFPWKRLALWGGSVYLALVVSALVALAAARFWAQQQLSDVQAHSEWQQWQETRELHQEPASSGPRTSTPTPPTLLMLRDHFWLTIGGVIAIGSVIYWTGVFLMCGVATSRQPVRHRVESRD